ncbi:MAG: hypothetical protein U0168_12905 [Nannocystaceae bacterium]
MLPRRLLAFVPVALFACAQGSLDGPTSFGFTVGMTNVTVGDGGDDTSGGGSDSDTSAGGSSGGSGSASADGGSSSTGAVEGSSSDSGLRRARA